MLEGVKVLKVTLYVKGERTTEVEDISYQGYIAQIPATGGAGSKAPTSPRVFPDYKDVKITKHKSVLPEDQKALVEMVKTLAVKYGFELKVIDLGKNRLLDRLDTRLKGIRSFPTLLLRIEGDITEEQIKALLTS
jgi:hypothetical protein